MSAPGGPPPNYTEANQDTNDAACVRFEYDNAGYGRLSSLSAFHGNTRTPVDLILVLDISGSMNLEVEGVMENSGFTRFDLVRHAVNVITGNLSSNDYITLIVFNQSAKVVLRRRPVTSGVALEISNTLKSITCEGQTNLYDAIKTAYTYIAKNPLEQTKEEFINRHIIAISDGEPTVLPGNSTRKDDEANVECYHRLMDEMLSKSSVCERTLLHVFGLTCTSLKDELLAEIAHKGHGMFGFISDSVIVTPCFINILGIIFNMFVTGLTLEFGETTKIFIPWILQSGFVNFKIPNNSESQCRLISNTNRVMRLAPLAISNEHNLFEMYKLQQSTAEKIITMLANHYRLSYENIKQYRAFSLPEIQSHMKDILNEMKQAEAQPAFQQEDEKQQLQMLYSDVDIFNRIQESGLKQWAPFCLYSLATSLRDDYVTNAYEKYYKTKAKAASSTRLQDWLEQIEQVAKNISPPNPSIKKYVGDGGGSSSSSNNYNRSNYQPPAYDPSPPSYYSSSSSNNNYSSYYSSSSSSDYNEGCIFGECLVAMADGGFRQVKDISIGDQVRTDSASGVGIVRCSLLVPTNKLLLLPNDLRLTPMHPLRQSHKDEWILPFQHPDQKEQVYETLVDAYSFLLEPSSETSCAMQVNGFWVVHFAHNSNDPVLKHAFYGTDKMRETVERLDPHRTGRILVTKALRDENNQVCEYEGVAMGSN